jgi:hypothetical protein
MSGTFGVVDDEETRFTLNNDAEFIFSVHVFDMVRDHNRQTFAVGGGVKGAVEYVSCHCSFSNFDD